MYYPSSENKGADQLRGYHEADLRLCFRICRLLVFLCGGSFIWKMLTCNRCLIYTNCKSFISIFHLFFNHDEI